MHCLLLPPFPGKNLKHSQLIQSTFTAKPEEELEEGEKFCDKKTSHACTNGHQEDLTDITSLIDNMLWKARFVTDGNVSPLVANMLIEISDTIMSENFYNCHRKHMSDALWIPHIITTCIHNIIFEIAEISSNCIHIDNLNQGILPDVSTRNEAMENFEQVKANINSWLHQQSIVSLASHPRSCTFMSNKSNMNFVENIHQNHKNKLPRASNATHPISNSWLLCVGWGLPTLTTISDGSRMC